MTPSSVVIGERYEDNSGWSRRVKLDTVESELEISLGGSHICAHSGDLNWLIEALLTARNAITP